jgi:acetolactate synthase-1/2/3 large subunit
MLMPGVALVNKSVSNSSASGWSGCSATFRAPEDIVPAIRRGIAKTREGIPVLLEFITSKETEVSRPGT